nr:hypothetical protein [Tanacetum cinerariifolium]
MAPFTFADTHNMVLFLCKLDASEGFDQIVDFLNAHTIQYALLVNPTISVSCIKQFYATATVKKVNDIVQLHALIDGKKMVVSKSIIRSDLHLDDADGDKCLPNEEIFTELARMGYGKPHTKLTFYKAKVFSCVETPLFALMLVQPQPQAEKEVEIPVAPAPPSTTSAPSPPALQDPTPTPHATPLQDQHSTPHDLPPQEQPTTHHESSMLLLNTLMETDVETNEEVVAMDVESQEKINQEEVNAASKGVSATEPTVFDDEEVTMTMVQTFLFSSLSSFKFAIKLASTTRSSSHSSAFWSV